MKVARFFRIKLLAIATPCYSVLFVVFYDFYNLLNSSKHWLNYENAMHMSIFIITQSRQYGRAMSELSRIVYKFGHVHRSNLKVNLARNLLSDSVKRIISTLKSLRLCQLIKEPTKVTAQAATLLDLIATNYERFICKSGVFNASLSDHNL